MGCWKVEKRGFEPGACTDSGGCVGGWVCASEGSGAPDGSEHGGWAAMAPGPTATPGPPGVEAVCGGSGQGLTPEGSWGGFAQSITRGGDRPAICVWAPSAGFGFVSQRAQDPTCWAWGC